MEQKVKKVIRKTKEFDYFTFFKIICVLGLLALLIVSADGCVV